MLSDLNPHLALKPKEELIRPDGDVELTKEDVDKFKLISCPKCRSDTMKPDVIFFGDNVPKQRVQKVRNLVSDCDILLVIGSSLDVYSGYRIVLQAKEENKKVALINIGPTRAFFVCVRYCGFFRRYFSDNLQHKLQDIKPKLDRRQQEHDSWCQIAS